MGKFYQKIMGKPLVYDYLRPLFLGGITVKPAYDWLNPVDNEVILDVGCGTGVALSYLTGFSQYHGFDTDEIALAALKERYGNVSNVNIYNRHVTQSAVEQINPHKVLMMGLLHHVNDEVAISLLQSMTRSKNLIKIVSIDVFYGKGAKHLTSNALASLDRGKFIRTPEGYKELLKSTTLHIHDEMYLRSGNGLACYYIMDIRP